LKKLEKLPKQLNKTFKNSPIKKYTTEREGRAMDIREAVRNYGGVVKVKDVNGVYIGGLLEVYKSNHVWKTFVCVLAVLQYPSQKDGERKPHQYRSIHNYYLGEVEPYSTNLPPEQLDKQFYQKSIQNAIVDRVQYYGLADDPEKQTLIRHLDQLRGAAAC
jgi:hypothetical protein